MCSVYSVVFSLYNTVSAPSRYITHIVLHLLQVFLDMWIPLQKYYKLRNLKENVILLKGCKTRVVCNNVWFRRNQFAEVSCIFLNITLGLEFLNCTLGRTCLLSYSRQELLSSQWDDTLTTEFYNIVFRKMLWSVMCEILCIRNSYHFHIWCVVENSFGRINMIWA